MTDPAASSGSVASSGSSAASRALEDLLAGWLPRQRWFAGKGEADAAVEVRSVGMVELPAPGEVATRVRVHLVRAGGALYQVPLTYHPAPVDELAHAALGVLTVDGAARWVHDGPHDPLYVRAVLRLMAREDGAGDPGDGVTLRGVRQVGGGAIDEAATSSVLRGEQSNTSVVIGADTPEALILKVFRVVHPGRNPDVVVQSALAAAGCTRVPQPAGWVEGTWFDHEAADGADRGDGGDGARHGHLAFAVEFLGGSEDAWRVATRAVATGASFAGPAHDLGVATAEVHELLARHLPTQPMTAEAVAELGAGLRRRVDWAVGQVPDLAPFADAARAAVDLGGLPDGEGALRPVLQQVHGDYHLGQVLHAPERGWVLLDFEGEPLRPLAERLAPDLALRDVAGMLRSFDYAAGYLIVSRPDDPDVEQQAQAWADEARTAFLAGYAERIGHDLGPQAALLHALELDKALYEVVYETRNRPDWVAIPWRAVRTLLAPPT